MALPADYISGTITLTNGSPNFTGTGTGWQAADFREGDILLGVEDHAGQVYVIAAITSQTSGTLTQDWAGTSGTYTYRMRYEWDSSRVSAQARAMVELLGNGNLQALANLTGPGVPVFNGPHAMEVRPVTDFINGVAYDVQVDALADRDAYDGQSAGFSVLVSDMGDGRSALFSKASNASGDWTDPAYVTGPVGPEPDLQAGTASRGPLGMSFTPVGAGYELDLTIPTQAAQGDYSGATAYITGDIVQQNGSSWVALQDTTGNAPPSLPTTSNTFWQLLARAGMDGAGTVTTVVGGAGISVDTTDPTAPVVSVAREVAAKSANYTVVAGDNGNVITVDASGAARTITLLPAATAGNGFKLIVKKSDSSANTVTIDGDGSETIDGETTKVLRLQHQSVALICDGTAWHVMGEGAVFARGSNANGQFVRLANGLQICWSAAAATMNVNQANGALYISTTTPSWTYPAVFASPPTLLPGQGGSGNGLRWVTTGTPHSASVTTLRAVSPSQSNVDLDTSAAVIGWWF